MKRKNGFIVNQGKKAGREELRRRLEFNKLHYERPREEVEAIVLPRPMTTSKMIEAKEMRLLEVQDRLEIVEEMILKRKQELWNEGRVLREELEDERMVEEFPEVWVEDGKESVFKQDVDGKSLERKPVIGFEG